MKKYVFYCIIIILSTTAQAGNRQNEDQSEARKNKAAVGDFSCREGDQFLTWESSPSGNGDIRVLLICKNGKLRRIN